MSASTITVTGQLGAGSFTVARRLADELGFRYYDWEITSQAAAQVGVSPEAVVAAERVPPLAERIMERFFSAGFFGTDIPEAALPTSISLDAALQTLSTGNYRDLIAQVVISLAERGSSVIVGHTAQVTLQDHPDVLKIFLHGSVPHRVRRLMRDEGIPEEQARSAIEANDRDRSAFFKHYYKLNWLDASLYDLSLSTDLLDEDQVVAFLLQAAREYEVSP